jgi:hypothetical protein
VRDTGVEEEIGGHREGGREREGIGRKGGKEG